MLGETAFIKFEIVNYSDQELSIGVGGDYRNEYGRPDSYKVKVIRNDGKDVSRPPVKMCVGGLLGSARIPPHGVYLKRLFLPHWGIFEKAGTYTITVIKTFNPHVRGSDALFEFPVKLTTTIKVAPYNREKMGLLIDSLAQTMLSPNTEADFRQDPTSVSAAQILARINDTRVIKYFDEAITSFQGADQFDDGGAIVRIAAYSLSTFNDDTAIEALERAAHSSNEETRLNIADAFSASKHPRAFDLLLAMRNDPYWFVRLRVVQRLGKSDAKASSALLSEMAEDENEDVRKQAHEFLDARKSKAPVKKRRG